MFRPINAAHAIAEEVLFIDFDPNLAAIMPTIVGVKDRLPDFGAEITQEFQVQINPDGSQKFSQLPSGLQLSRFRTNGAPEWLLSIGAARISIHCLDYSRWVQVWTETKRFLKLIFREIGAAQVSISAIGLKYVDRFTWDGDVEKYDASTLFKRDTSLLHSRAFSSGSRWHCHTGWFQTGHLAGEVLNQLNIDSGNGIVNGIATVLVSIDHTQTLRRQAANALDQFGKLTNDDASPLDSLMSFLHARNKDTLSGLLTEPVAKSIKLLT